MPRRNKSKNFCSYCLRAFTTKQNLMRHITKFHPTVADNLILIVQVKCSICEKGYNCIVDLHNHLQTDHSDIHLSFENKIFYSIEQFDQWKLEVEREAEVAYIKLVDDRLLSDGKILTDYFCSQKEHHELPQNAAISCPSHITVSKEINKDVMKIQIVYQSTHLGIKTSKSASKMTITARDIEISSDKNKISCAQYSNTISKESYFQTHTAEFHAEDTSELNSSNFICSICRKVCKSIVALQSHFKTDHNNISLSFENMIFYSMEEFMQWLKAVELKSQTSFKKFRGDKRLSDGRISMNFFCYPNQYDEHSQKVIFTCPAHIIAFKRMQEDKMEIQVEHQIVHVGHDFRSQMSVCKENTALTSVINPSNTSLRIESDTLKIGTINPEILSNSTNQTSLNKITKRTKSSISCTHCVCTFTTKQNLYRHMQRFHPTAVAECIRIFHVICSICNKNCKSIADLHSHFVADHTDVKLSFENKVFYSMEDFAQWKLEIEYASQTSFIKHRGDKCLKDGRVAMNFFCYRSRHNNSKNEQQNSLDIDCSKKQFSCPAHITAYKEMNEEATEIQVYYQAVHVGHTQLSDTTENDESDDKMYFNNDIFESTVSNEISGAEMQMVTKYKFNCSQCVCTFTTKQNLRRHVKKFHPEATDTCLPVSRVICSICEKNCKSIIGLHRHFQTDHTDINLSFQKKEFYCMEDFEQWKLDVERESHSSFIKRRANRELCDGRIAISFLCHRSGSYELKKERQRRVKGIGTQKIGFACPAHIAVYKEVYEEIMQIQVEYQSVHVGHECDIRRVPLSKPEKIKLAECLKMGIPKATILSNIKKEFPPNDRISLTTRQDLLNICRDFKINNEAVMTQNNAPSDNLDKKTEGEEENPVLIFLQHFSYGLSAEQQDTNNFDCGLSIMTNDNVENPKQEYIAETVIEQNKIPEVNSIEEERAVVVSELQNLFAACESPLVSSDQLKLLKDGISALKAKFAASSSTTVMMPSITYEIIPEHIINTQ